MVFEQPPSLSFTHVVYTRPQTHFGSNDVALRIVRLNPECLNSSAAAVGFCWHEFTRPANLIPFSMLSILIFCSMFLTSEAAGLTNGEAIR